MSKDNKDSRDVSLAGRSACISGALGIPPEAIYGLSCVSLIGDSELYIENYISMLEFNDRRIKLRVKGGNLIIEGNNLRILYFNNINMQIKGIVSSLLFEKRNA